MRHIQVAAALVLSMFVAACDKGGGEATPPAKPAAPAAPEGAKVEGESHAKIAPAKEVALKIRVEGLAETTDNAKLLAEFSQFNAVTAEVEVDKTSGKSRGFGFVTFKTAEDAKKAREAMDGKTLEGKTLKIIYD